MDERTSTTIRFHIRRGDFEVELEGDPGYVKPQYEELLKEFKPSVVAGPLQPTGSTRGDDIETNATTVTARIEHLLQSGFLDQPRPLREIIDELARIGFSYGNKTVDNALRDLVRKQIIRRVGAKGSYKYVRR